MRADTWRFLFVSFGFALSLGIAGQGGLAPRAETAIFVGPGVLPPVVADEGAGSDDPDSGEDEGGDDSD
jgi:hypothetical protein